MQYFQSKTHPLVVPCYKEITVKPNLKFAIITIELSTVKNYVARMIELILLLFLMIYSLFLLRLTLRSKVS